jgi:hypothetical protein
MSWKYKNKRREIQENLSNDSYVFLSYYIFQMQSTYIPSRAAELPRQSVYMVIYSSRLFLPGTRQGESLGCTLLRRALRIFSKIT